MTEENKTKIEAIYNSFMEKPLSIQEIFNDFFGEEFVDMQGCPTFEEFVYVHTEDEMLSEGFEVDTSLFNLCILVKFPEVRITNENNKFTDIYDLYAKVPFNYTGKLRSNFRLNRTTYTNNEVRSDYMHSHVKHIPVWDFTEFQSPCLGSGPIKVTQAALVSDTFDPLMWQLFCFELSKYVMVESLDGTPYNKLEDIGKKTIALSRERYQSLTVSHILPTSITRSQYKAFIKWFISRNKLQFSYCNGYNIAMSYLNWALLVSNEFIEWYNSPHTERTLSYHELVRNNILREVVIKDGHIYKVTSSETSIQGIIGKEVCKFKGETVRISIKESNDSTQNNISVLLNNQISEYILLQILYLVNHEYNNTKARIENDTQTYFI